MDVGSRKPDVFKKAPLGELIFLGAKFVLSAISFIFLSSTELVLSLSKGSDRQKIKGCRFYHGRGFRQRQTQKLFHHLFESTASVFLHIIHHLPSSNTQHPTSNTPHKTLSKIMF